MTDLVLTLFGQPNLKQNGQVVEFKSRKGWALLAYLALMPNPVSREELATLFWPERDATAARRNLRRLFYTLNQSPIEPFLQINADVIWLAWQGTIDVQVFVTSVKHGEWETAVSLYQGELLAGIYIPDSNLFETWLNEQRQQLRQELLQAQAAQISRYLEAGKYDKAESSIRNKLSFDNWDEATWRQLMTVLAENGNPAQALSEHQNCKRLLEAELGVAPAAETTALYEAIRDGRFGQKPDHRYAVPPPSPLPHPKARQALLDKVQTYWIDTVLRQSLHGYAAVNLDKAAQPDAITYPWTTLLKRDTHTQTSVPTQQPIVELFDNGGRALLILGAPGAGKTTMLLELAKQMLSRAQDDAAHPIPVVINLASWRGQSLAAWAAAEINEKYLIPKDIVADWLAADQLLLLCDGLDELPTDLQRDCVTAVNQFRQTRGLTPIAICSREAEYDTLDVSLNLNSAVLLRPLTPEQADSYLRQWGQRLSALRNMMRAEEGLQLLARSPLLLSIMALVFQGMTKRQLELMGTATGESKHLFAVYVQQMFKRQGENGGTERSRSGRFTAMQMQNNLHWLASELTARNQPLFLLERLQPDWLPNRKQMGLYFFLSRLIGGFILGAAWSFRDNGAAAVPIGLFFGVLIAVIELLLFVGVGDFEIRRLSRFDFRRFWRTVVVVTAVALFTAQSGWIALANAFIFGLFFGWRQPSHTTSDDIRMIEQLAWNWRSFGKGLLWGLLIGAGLFILNRDNLYSASTTLLSIVVLLGALFGLQGKSIPTKTRPNEGMYLSWRNAWLGGAVVGGAMFVAALVIEFSRSSSLWLPLWVGLQYGVMAGLWYGGLDLVNHFVLRGLLALNGKLPWQAVSFLEQAAQLIFLYRIGSGYMFVHPLLQAHFAEIENVVTGGREQAYSDETLPGYGSV